MSARCLLSRRSSRKAAVRFIVAMTDSVLPSPGTSPSTPPRTSGTNGMVESMQRRQTTSTLGYSGTDAAGFFFFCFYSLLLAAL